MEKALGIPLGIDFAAIDRGLNEVADKIEAMGKKVKIGVNMSGEGGSVGMDLSGFGDRMASGVASGIRSSSALMMGFAARFEGAFDKFGGAAITTFKRLDASMKFPAFDAFLRRAKMGLDSLAGFTRKPMSNIQVALKGGFGSALQNLTAVFQELLTGLGRMIARDVGGAVKEVSKTITTGLIPSVEKLAASFVKVSGGVGAAAADAAQFMATVEKTAAVVDRFPMGSKGLKSVVGGPRIGTGTDFTGPGGAAPAAQAAGVTAATKEAVSWTSRLFKNLEEIRGPARDVGAGLNLLPVRIVAAVGAAAIGTYGALRRVANIASSIGPVTKKGMTGLFNSMVRISTLGFVSNATESIGRFNNSIVSSNSLLGKMIGTVTGLGGALLAAFGVVGVVYKTVQFLTGGVKAASDLNVAVERSKVVFGSSFGVVESQVDALNKQFRISKQEQMDMAAGFGNIAQGAGMSEQAAAGFANKMVKMAADMKASGKVDTFQEAGDAITSALTGRGMELKKLGAVMDEDAVKAYSLAQGYRAAGEEMGRSDTLMTRAELVMRGLSDAQGALERNAGTSAEAFAKAGGGVQEFATQAGQLLLPAVMTLTDAFNTLMGSTLTFFETNKAAIAGWAETIKQEVEFVGVIVRNLDIVWEMVQLQFGMHVENMVRWAETLGTNFVRIFEWLKKNWLDLLMDIGALILQFSMNVIKNFANLGAAAAKALWTGEFKFDFTPMLEGFHAAAEALPEMVKPALINVDGQMKELGDKMTAREIENIGKVKAAGAAPGKPGALPELEKDKKGADYKLASAMEINSKEAASVIARSQTAGVGKGDKQAEHLKVAKDSNQTLESINNKLGTGTQRLVVKNGR